MFVISWANPDEKLADTRFDDYLGDGMLAAVDVIEQQAGEKEINAVGYCLGGTLLATALAWMAGNKDKRIASGTFFTTMLDFSEPRGIELAGVPIDLGKIKVPCYFISTMEDHIAPWKSTYLGTRLLGGPVRFVLGGSGHIAGIVNPPAANKYGYWLNEASRLPKTADDWLADARQHGGSWWKDWNAWVTWWQE